MSKKFKTTQYTGTVAGAYEAALSEIEGLRDEMDEWASNMEDNGMEHMPKYDEVEEARDALTEAYDALEGLDIPATVADASVTYSEARPYGRRPMPRWMRLSNAESMLNAAKDALEQARDEPAPECECDNPPEDKDKVGDDHEIDCPLHREDDDQDLPDFDTPIDAMDEAIGSIDNVIFPGMY